MRTGTARPRASPGPDAPWGHDDGLRLHRQLAPVRHRVARVQNEVEQDLPEHAAVGPDRIGGQRGVQVDLDLVRQDPPQQFQGLSQEFAHAEALELHAKPRLAQPSDQLAAEPGRVVGCGLDLPQRPRHGSG